MSWFADVGMEEVFGGDYALEVTNLTKKFSDFTLDDIKFSKLPKGYTGFVGRNGREKRRLLIWLQVCIIKTRWVRIDGNRAEDEQGTL